MTDVKNREARILIVDDEPAMRMALREVLKRGGWTVEVAEHAEAGLERLREQSAEPFDLVITDNRMPGMSGLELLKLVREEMPSQPMVMMTAFGTVEDAVSAMKVGASDFLMKPFSYETVVDVVTRVLNTSGKFTDSDATREKIEARPTPAATKPQTEGRALIAESPLMRDVVELAGEVAEADATILLNGESGTGKEVLARLVHDASHRSGEFVAVNCAALPEGLLESELFGHEKGAFTGAMVSRKGRFEQASGGTLLLDEISEMPLALQAKLLRVIQEKEVTPVGGEQTVKLDVRIIATTNRNLEAMVDAGEFRQDLYYRLNVISLTLPPLRDREGDVVALADFFLHRFQRPNRPALRMSSEVRGWLTSYDWPGNVRELENMVERACLLARGEEIRIEDLHLRPNQRRTALHLDSESTQQTARKTLNFEETLTLEEMERRMILNTLDRTGGNRTRAAEVLGVSVRTIRNKLNAYGVAEISA